MTSPISWPIFLRRISALSCLKSSLYSALDVIILYGSWFSLVTRSSISTPIYAWDRSRTTCSLPMIFIAAFTPAINPWTAASSYPELPLNCPPANRPDIFLNSKVGFNCRELMQSYSIAYAFLTILTFSSPGTVRYIAYCTSSGRELLMPPRYISLV